MFDHPTRSLLIRTDGEELFLPVLITPPVGHPLVPGFIGEVNIVELHEGVTFDPRPGTVFEVWYGDVIGRGVVSGPAARPELRQ